MTIPLLAVERQLNSIESEIKQEIEEVINRGWFVLGENLERFEREFADYCGVKYAIGVGSGTDALLLSLKALGIGRGDEVLVPTNTFIATAEAVTHAGATPIFTDIDPKTFNIDISDVPVNLKTKAVIPVHLCGQPAEMERVCEFAKKHNLKIIEDACQAHGATYKGEKAGSIGDTGCFSFFPTKPLSALGDGGIVTTNDKEVAERIRQLRNHGRSELNTHATPGYTSRLDEIQAAVLLAKLKYLDKWNFKKQKMAEKYSRLLEGIEGIETPYTLPYVTHVYYLYVIKVRNRDLVKARLKEKGIETGIHYPLPIHLQPAYSQIPTPRLIHAEDLAGEILSLPMFPQLTDEEVKYVADALIDVCRPLNVIKG